MAILSARHLANHTFHVTFHAGLRWHREDMQSVRVDAMRRTEKSMGLQFNEKHCSDAGKRPCAQLSCPHGVCSAQGSQSPSVCSAGAQREAAVGDLERRSVAAEQQRTANEEAAAQLASQSEALAADVAAARERSAALEEQRRKVDDDRAEAEAAAAAATMRLEEAASARKVPRRGGFDPLGSPSRASRAGVDCTAAAGKYFNFRHLVPDGVVALVPARLADVLGSLTRRSGCGFSDRLLQHLGLAMAGCAATRSA